MQKTWQAKAIVLAITLLAPACHAGLITFDLQYSGASFSNGATAIGSVTFDDTILPNPGNVFAAPGTIGVTAFSLTVSGASAGNGTFLLSDTPNNWIWSTNQALNLSQQLVGQAGFSDFNFCLGAACGTAPSGTAPFTITTNGAAGDQLLLTSMLQSSVPEPASIALMGLGLAAIAFKFKKRVGAVSR